MEAASENWGAVSGHAWTRLDVRLGICSDVRRYVWTCLVVSWRAWTCAGASLHFLIRGLLRLDVDWRVCARFDRRAWTAFVYSRFVM